MKPQIFLVLSSVMLSGFLYGQRDPLKWPFDKTSIWNMPIHNNALYTPASIPEPTYGVQPEPEFIFMDKNAPLTDVKVSDVGWSGGNRCLATGPTFMTVPIASSFIFDAGIGGGANAPAAFLMPDGHTIKNTQPFSRCIAGSYATGLGEYEDNDIYTDGIVGAHGGSGLSTLGGCIRLGELVPGGEIRHAIKINVNNTHLYYSDTNPGFMWPAQNADGYAQNVYSGTNPAVLMGTLLALPPSVDINNIGLTTEPGKILAKCLQNYGAYIVDDPYWEVVMFGIEVSPNGNVEDEFVQHFGFSIESDASTPWATDIAKIVTSLHAITNNDASNVGGGPTNDLVNRRAPIAPEFDIQVPVKEVSVSPNDFSLYPNPASEFIFIKINSNALENTVLKIINGAGQIKHTITQSLNIGENNIKISLQEMNLPAGVYFINVNSNSISSIKKIIIHKGNY
ncbi:MAG: T9SS type A sorting domain-containing protein [Saprospiraceae bacterium]